MILACILAFLIPLAFMTIVCSLLFAKTILFKMENDLETWISFGTADDIWKIKEHRPEYQSYVEVCEKDPIKSQSIPKYVLIAIRRDLESKNLYLPIYIRILCLILQGKKI